jgi:hypothetical protein
MLLLCVVFASYCVCFVSVTGFQRGGYWELLLCVVEFASYCVCVAVFQRGGYWEFRCFDRSGGASGRGRSGVRRAQICMYGISGTFASRPSTLQKYISKIILLFFEPHAARGVGLKVTCETSRTPQCRALTSTYRRLVSTGVSGRTVKRSCLNPIRLCSILGTML